MNLPLYQPDDDLIDALLEAASASGFRLVTRDVRALLYIALCEDQYSSGLPLEAIRQALNDSHQWLYPCLIRLAELGLVARKQPPTRRNGPTLAELWRLTPAGRGAATLRPYLTRAPGARSRPSALAR
jgi:hypothetical protein